MKTLLIFCLLFFSASLLRGQTSFGYDASGNRTSRTIVLPRQLAPSAPNQSKAKKKKDVGETYKDSTTEAQPQPYVELPETVYEDKLVESDVFIYPNPTQGALAVEIRNMNAETSYRLDVFNMNGAVVFERSKVSGYTAIDLSTSPKGIYILRISTGNSFVSWKIIKE
ncbi:MAG: T9SS type A sorting domain-containing protein [Bacteroidales bacterium]|jgi:hypothetical protein|nr:T9SS type A sorting domain-containing protein [Bacteroidales bacterium]